MSTSRAIRLSTALVAIALLVAGCGDDEDSAGPASDGSASPAGRTIPVVATDYAFGGLPVQAKAGGRLTLTNQSDQEIHELVAVRLPDNEKRPAADLVRLPMEELEPLMGDGPPATVLLAPPSRAAQINAVGDGTLAEPGRYLLFCFIPTGADPKAYLAAAENAKGPPQVEGGPPHFTQGMYAEVLIEG